MCTGNQCFHMFLCLSFNLIFFLHSSLSIHSMLSIPFSLVLDVTFWIHEFRGLPFPLLPGGHHSFFFFLDSLSLLNNNDNNNNMSLHRCHDKYAQILKGPRADHTLPILGCIIVYQSFLRSYQALIRSTLFCYGIIYIITRFLFNTVVFLQTKEILDIFIFLYLVHLVAMFVFTTSKQFSLRLNVSSCLQHSKTAF